MSELINKGEIDPIGDVPDKETAVERHTEIQDSYIRLRDEDHDPSRVKKDGDLRAPLRYMTREIEQGDFIWVNEGSEFAVCRVTGEWTTDLDLGPREQEKYERRGIHNFRNAEWNPIPYTFVPGFVKRRFAGRGNTLSQMHIDDSQKKLTSQLYSAGEFDNPETIESIAESVTSKLQTNVASTDLMQLLDPAEVEDIVLMQLQTAPEPWSVIKSTTSSSEADIECELRRMTNGSPQRAFLQVKTGDAAVDPEEYTEKAEYGQVFLFCPNLMNLQPYGNMNEITAEELLVFARENTGMLPDPVLIKLDTLIEN